MKLGKHYVPSQILILVLASLMMLFLLQVANAQSPGTQGNQAQVLQMDMPQKTLGRRLMENTTLNYYHQVLGPTVAGTGGETYNVFQEARSPYQSFHAANIIYRVNPDWAVGASIAAVNAYGDTVTNQQTGFKSNSKVRDEFFNARAFVALPAFKTALANLFTTISYEAPTSVFSRTNNERFGYVIAQSLGLNLASLKFTAGLMWQYYRMVYEENIVPPQNGFLSFARQTVIFNGGPYATYRFNDKWGMNSTVVFDWDQRGKQTGTGSFNNNLPDRARVGVSYFPQKVKQIANVGVFTQTLLDYSQDTHVLGAELAMRF